MRYALYIKKVREIHTLISQEELKFHKAVIGDREVDVAFGSFVCFWLIVVGAFALMTILEVRE